MQLSVLYNLTSIIKVSYDKMLETLITYIYGIKLFYIRIERASSVVLINAELAIRGLV